MVESNETQFVLPEIKEDDNDRDGLSVQIYLGAALRSLEVMRMISTDWNLAFFT